LLPPPPNTIDAGPSAPAPGPDSVYVSGTWVYRVNRFAWRPGFWYTPRAGWVWVPARYVWTPGGYIFIEGYWDYPLTTRGLLFAPVVIERRLWRRPRWVYRPQVVVYEPALLGCLFIRPDYGCYYFGDYFEPAYRDRGFVAWIDFRIGRSFDPLLSFCRWQHRRDRYWDRDLRSLYVNRYNGDAPRPPRTIVQQNTVINNITVNNNVNVTTIRNVTVLAPITKVDKTIVNVRPVSRAQMAEQQRAVVQMREAAKERQKIAAQLVARGSAPTRPTDRPVVARVQLPRTPTVIKSTTAVKPPAPPVLPRTVVKTLPKTDPVKPIKPPVNPVKPVKPPVNPVKPVKPRVNPAKPPVNPPKPPVNPVKPPVNPVKPIKPPVNPVKPPVNPVKPPVNPVKPPVNPVKPVITVKPVNPAKPPVKAISPKAEVKPKPETKTPPPPTPKK
jgi:hypothetical protein